MTLSTRLEAVLFAIAEPVNERRLCEALQCSTTELAEAVTELKTELATHGLRLLGYDHQLELVTFPEASPDIQRFRKDEEAQELSRPSLETLALLAYRGPLTRSEIEQVRGVQSSQILRLLQMRSLVEEYHAVNKFGQPIYQLTVEALRVFGVTSLEELPEYAELHTNHTLTQIIPDQTN